MGNKMFKMLSLYGSLLSATLIFASNSVVPAWHGASPRDLHHEYGNIFRHGNRNAASHLWSSFVLQRSSQMNAQRFEDVASGYCAVSGSPVQPQDYTRYLLRLDSVEGKESESRATCTTAAGHASVTRKISSKLIL